MKGCADLLGASPLIWKGCFGAFGLFPRLLLQDLAAVHDVEAAREVDHGGEDK